MTTPLFGDPRVHRSADISDDGIYRYRLVREWGPGPAITFCMLNPSTADADLDDRTISKCIGFAKREGAEAIRVVNLFALRATDPRDLARHTDPVGPMNHQYLAALSGLTVIAAWGAEPFATERAEEVVALHPVIRWQCLGTTASGAPRHPLYLPADAPLGPWVP